MAGRVIRTLDFERIIELCIPVMPGDPIEVEFKIYEPLPSGQSRIPIRTRLGG